MLKRKERLIVSAAVAIIMIGAIATIQETLAGTPGTIAKFNTTTTLDDSIMNQTNNTITIRGNSTSPACISFQSGDYKICLEEGT